VAAMFESLATCPESLLLFMHHVPYTYRLHSGATVIQHIYDRHYAGAAQAADFVRRWSTLRGRIDEPLYNDVLARLEYQAGHAEEWRDAVDRYFFAKSGIPDEKGRVGAGTPAGRVEAESMQLHGFVPVDVTPPEAASGARAIHCRPFNREPSEGSRTLPRRTALGKPSSVHAIAPLPSTRPHCVARFRYAGAAGPHDLTIRYFDPNGGAARFRLRVAGRVVDEWFADDQLPSNKLDAHTSSRRRVTGIALRPGDEIAVEGTPDASDPAAVDYIDTAPSDAAPATPAAR
jgi:alpha-glucuronidase